MQGGNVNPRIGTRKGVVGGKTWAGVLGTCGHHSALENFHPKQLFI